MPRSKRNKQIELAKTKKRGLEWKKGLFEEVRSCVEKYENVFVFSVNDMRNNKMKTVREQWKHSRFFIGKNKIMAMALGRFAEEEYKPNLHKVGQQIKGQRGLLFSNKPVEEVLSWFRSYSEGDYARSGNTATETVNLPAGPLTMFPHNLEPYLRQLGLPTTLERGIVQLTRDHEVCKAGDTLTPETAKILKLLGYEMAEFHVTIDCVWSKDGTFMQLTQNIDSGFKENKKKVRFSRPTIIGEKNDDDEKMEMEQDDFETCLYNDYDDDDDGSDDDDDDDDNLKEIKNCIDNTPDIVCPTLNSSIITITSTPKAENEILNMKKDSKDADECDMEEIAQISEDKIAEECNMEKIAETTEDKSNSTETSEIIVNKNETKATLVRTECNVDEISENNAGAITEKNEEHAQTSIENETSENKNIIEEMSEDINENGTDKLTEKTDDKCNVEEEVAEKNIDISEKNEEQVQTSKRSRSRVSAKTPRNNKKQKVAKNDSLLKTPDANTSLDSPVFRELRNRSVKVNRKKK